MARKKQPAPILSGPALSGESRHDLPGKVIPDTAAQHAYVPDPNQPGECAHCDRPRADRIHPPAAGQSRPARLDERIVAGEPLDKFTDFEIVEYVSFVLECCAHLQGGIGALVPARVLGLADRLRLIGSAHRMNVRDPANWAAGPRADDGVWGCNVKTK